MDSEQIPDEFSERQKAICSSLPDTGFQNPEILTEKMNKEFATDFTMDEVESVLDTLEERDVVFTNIRNHHRLSSELRETLRTSDVELD